MTEVRRFAILAAPRTGSNLLCTLLNSHPQVLCHHEVFNPQGVFTALGYQGDRLQVDSLEQRDDQPIEFLGRIWRTAESESAVGFKWTRGQDQLVLNQVLSDVQVKKIVLRRRNRIKTYVSERIAQQTQQWEVYSRDDLIVPRPRIQIDVHDLLAHIELNETFYDRIMQRLTERQSPHLELEYETLFERDVQIRTFRFLEVPFPDRTPTAHSVKQNPNDLRDTIENFDQLADQLAAYGLLSELLDREM